MIKYLIQLLFLMLPLQVVLAKTSMLMTRQYQQHQYRVFQVQDLAKLQLVLKKSVQNNPQPQFLHTFQAWQKQLGTCQQLSFAMNAGMFHPDYVPVGLYIERGQQKVALNTEGGLGNFFLKPNGVLAWNEQAAFIGTTEQWMNADFDADYATQSGPMLVIKGEIHPRFLVDSDSKKIRNGVGIKQGKLYFVMSQDEVSFYQFAQFFRDGLRVDNALYLDGSISSIYTPTQVYRNRIAKFGPMLGYVENRCQ